MRYQYIATRYFFLFILLTIAIMGCQKNDIIITGGADASLQITMSLKNGRPIAELGREFTATLTIRPVDGESFQDEVDVVEGVAQKPVEVPADLDFYVEVSVVYDDIRYSGVSEMLYIPSGESITAYVYIQPEEEHPDPGEVFNMIPPDGDHTNREMVRMQWSYDGDDVTIWEVFAAEGEQTPAMVGTTASTLYDYSVEDLPSTIIPVQWYVVGKGVDDEVIVTSESSGFTIYSSVLNVSIDEIPTQYRIAVNPNYDLIAEHAEGFWWLNFGAGEDSDYPICQVYVRELGNGEVITWSDIPYPALDFYNSPELRFTAEVPGTGTTTIETYETMPVNYEGIMYSHIAGSLSGEVIRAGTETTHYIDVQFEIYCTEQEEQ